MTLLSFNIFSVPIYVNMFDYVHSLRKNKKKLVFVVLNKSKRSPEYLCNYKKKLRVKLKI